MDRSVGISKSGNEPNLHKTSTRADFPCGLVDAVRETKYNYPTDSEGLGLATDRRVRRRQEREAKTRRARQARAALNRLRVPLWSRISSDWIVAGIIVAVILVAVLVFLFANIFRSGSSGDESEIYQVFAFAVDPDNPDKMLLGDVTGLFRSENGGRTWNKDETLVDPVRSIIADPESKDVWWATGGSVIWRSVDDGDSWNSVSTDLPQANNFTVLATDLLNPSQMYTVRNFGEERGLYKSNDGGVTWEEKLNFEGTNSTMTSLAVKPGRPDVLYGFHTVDGFVKSTNSGRTLIETGQGIPGNRVTDILTYMDEPSVVLAAAGGSIYKSEDSGETWVVKGEGLDGVEPRSLGRDSKTGTLYVVDFVGRVYVSADGGEYWSLNAGG